jgi:hypothetical protein
MIAQGVAVGFHISALRAWLLPILHLKIDQATRWKRSGNTILLACSFAVRDCIPYPSRWGHGLLWPCPEACQMVWFGGRLSVVWSSLLNR